MTKIIILDDHALFRQGTVRLLEAEPDLAIAAQCATIAETVDFLSRNPVDLVLLDYDLGADRGTDFVLQARQRSWNVRILVLTAGVTDRQALDLIGQGVDGIFPKTDTPETLIEAIREVMSGGQWFGSRYRELMQSGIPDAAPTKSLSARERLVLTGVVEGLANKEIAGRLDISESSVKAVLQQLFFKTGVRTRSQLVRVALDRYREIIPT